MNNHITLMTEEHEYPVLHDPSSLAEYEQNNRFTQKGQEIPHKNLLC